MMRFGRRTVVAVGALALLATACGDGGDGGATGDGAASPGETEQTAQFEGTEITFSINLAEEETAAVQSLLDQFSERTGASVDMASLTTEDLPDRLQVEVDAGRPSIHLFAVDNLALRTLVDRELVQPVSDVEVPDGVIESMVPEQFNDQEYFLPFRPNVQLTYVNRERLESIGAEQPQTVDELIDVATQMRDESGSGKLTLQFAEGGPAGVTVSEWIVMHGGDPLVLNDEGSVEAFTTLQQMWDDGLFAEETMLAKFDTQIDYLVGETAWMAQNWPFTSQILSDQGLLDRFEIYAGWEGPARGAKVIGGDVLGIPAGVEGDQLEAAQALAEYLMSQEAQEQLVAENAWPSIRDDALAQVPEEMQATFEAIQSALEWGWYRPNVPYWPEAQDAMNEAVRRIMSGGEDVQSTLDDLNSQIAEAAERAGEEYPPPSS